MLLCFVGRAAFICAVNCEMQVEKFHGTFGNVFQKIPGDLVTIGQNTQYGLPQLQRPDLTFYTVYSGLNKVEQAFGRAGAGRFTYVPTKELPYLLIFVGAEIDLAYGEHKPAYQYVHVLDENKNQLGCGYNFTSGSSVTDDEAAGFDMTCRCEHINKTYYGYRDWHVLYYDFTNYVGTTITIEAVSSQCSNIGCQTWLYLAFDAFAPTTFCGTGEPITMRMPSAVSSYEWHKDTPWGPIVGNDSVLTIDNPDATAYYCVLPPACNFAQRVLAGKAEKPVAKFDYSIDCDKVTFSDSSYMDIYPDKLHSAPDTVYWDFGDGRTSSLYDVGTFVFPDGEHTVTLRVGSRNFQCDSMFSKTFSTCKCRFGAEYDTICQSQGGFVWNDKTYTSTGVYIDTLVLPNGCDSIASLHLTVIPTIYKDITVRVCPNQLPYRWNGIDYPTGGDYQRTIGSSTHCDSIVTLHLIALQPSSGQASLKLCKGQTISYLGKYYSAAGTYKDTLVNAAGCDSIVTITITEKECSTPGEWGDHPLNPYIDCDTAYSYQEKSIKEAEDLPFTWNEMVVSAVPQNAQHDTTLVYQTLKADESCDSIATLHLIVEHLPGSVTIVPTYVHVNYDTLQANPYLWEFDQKIYTEPGFYADTIIDVKDTTIGQLLLTVDYERTIEACVGETVDSIATPWGTFGFDDCDCLTGCIKQTLDSICIIDAKLCRQYKECACDTVRDTLDITLPYDTLQARGGYMWFGEMRDTAGVYRDTIKTVAGCDSIGLLILRTQYADSMLVCGEDTAVFETPWGKYGVPRTCECMEGWIRKTADDEGLVWAKLCVTRLMTDIVREDTSLCYGTSIVWHGITVDQTKEYEYHEPFTRLMTCDSVVYYLNAVVKDEPKEEPTIAAVCAGETYTWNTYHDSLITEPGTYYDTLKTADLKCDSIHYVLTLTHKASSIGANDTTVCRLPVVWEDSTWAEAGMKTKILKNAVGCDSVVTLTLYVNEPTDQKDQDTIVCYGETLFWRNRLWKDLTKDSILRDTIKYNGSPCDSIRFERTIHVRAQAKDSVSNEYACYGADVEWRGQKLMNITATQTLTDKVSYEGTTCDSIRFEHTIHVLPKYTDNKEEQICTGGQYVWKRAGKKDSIITVEGEYYDTVRYVSTGCDSMTYYLKLTVGEINERKEQASACEGSIYTGWRREIIVPAMDSTYRDTVKAATLEECDTVFILNLRVNHATNQIDSDTMVCYGHNVFWRNRLWVDLTKDSILRDTIKYNGSPCDSIRFERTIHVRAQAKDSVSNEYACYGADMEWRGQKLMNITATQTLTDKVSYEGTTCDSIRFEHTIHVLPKYTDNKEEQICTGGQYVWKRAGKKDSIITVEGEYYDTVRYVATGCDSMTYYLKLTVGEINERKEQASACEGSIYTGWRREIIVPAMDSTYRDTVKAATLEECDTVFILNMTVLHKTSGDTIAYVCEGSTFYWRGQIAHHGDQITLTNAAGCDSIVTLHLTIKDCGCPEPTIKPTDVVYICDTLLPYKWLTYREIMVYRDTLLSDTLRSADNKCDSIIYTLDLSTYHCCQPLAGTMEVRNICADERVMDVIVKLTRGHFSSYRVHYANAPGNTMPFRDTLVTTVPQEQDGHVLLTLPVPHDATDRTRYPRPDQYGIEITLYDVCGNHLNLGHQTFDVYYPSWILDQHWDDVIAILNDRYNGGYTFSRIEWLRDGEVLPGEKELYIYMPHQLWTTADEQHRDYAYQALLTRSDDGKSILSCPMHPEHKDSTNVMTEPYVFVSPTLVPKENPIVHVQTNTEGTYWLYDPVGKLLHTADYEPCEHNVFDIELHYPVQTMYILVFTPRNETRPLKAKYRVVKLLME